MSITSVAPEDWVDLGDEHTVDASLSTSRYSASPEGALDSAADGHLPNALEAKEASTSTASAIAAASEPQETVPEPAGAHAKPEPELELPGPLAAGARVQEAGAEEDAAHVKEELGNANTMQEGDQNAERPTTPLREIGVDTPEPQDDRQCRICLGGAEDETELGRLISPCLCAGSMRFVHINCINEWRGSGANAKSFMECPQCGYEYSIRRTAVVGLATSRPLLILLTSLIFFTATLVAGHLLFKYLVALVEEEVELEAAAKKAGKTVAKQAKQAAYYDDDLYVWETNIVFLGGTTLIYDIISEAVHTFVVFAGDVYDFFAPNGTSGNGRVANAFVAVAVRLLLGLSILGSLSGLTLLASLSLFAPLQLVYALKGTGIFNGLRRRINQRNGTYLIVAFVLIGIVNSVVQVYDFVHSITSRILRYVETQIVEVHSPEALAHQRRTHPPGWWHRWWTERRWRTAAGWSEVRLRVWIAFKEWLRRWKEAAAEALHGNHGGQAVDVAG